jgi:hypothetical protein
MTEIWFLEEEEISLFAITFTKLWGSLASHTISSQGLLEARWLECEAHLHLVLMLKC